MSEQERKQRTKQSETSAEEVAGDSVHASDKGDQLKNDLDTLLDEIDGVLEENAEEFVRNYVQKGGE
jgi:prokaryotic ubiquitin-like protein Pup